MTSPFALGSFLVHVHCDQRFPASFPPAVSRVDVNSCGFLPPLVRCHGIDNVETDSLVVPFTNASTFTGLSFPHSDSCPVAPTSALHQIRVGVVLASLWHLRLSYDLLLSTEYVGFFLYFNPDHPPCTCTLAEINLFLASAAHCVDVDFCEFLQLRVRPPPFCLCSFLGL